MSSSKRAHLGSSARIAGSNSSIARAASHIRDEAVIARVGALARKEQLRSDAEAQTLEDVACLVFLRYYAANFAAKHASEKVFDILLKTQRKMSPRGRAAGLDFGFPAPILGLYKEGLRALEAAPTP